MPNRMFRDGLIHSGRINRVTPTAEMLFTRMVLAADDFGLIEIDPYYLKSRCVPSRDEVKASDIQPLLDELIEAKLLMNYASDGKVYAAIDKWEQRRNAKYPKCPMPPWGTTHIKGGYIDRKARTDDAKPAEKSKPAAGTDKPARKAESKGMRLDAYLDTRDDLLEGRMPDGWMEWSINNIPPALSMRTEWDSFVDYWKSQPGQKGVKADWEATWRNWCRKAVEMKQGVRVGAGPGVNRQEAQEERNRRATADWVPPEQRQQPRGE